MMSFLSEMIDKAKGIFDREAVVPDKRHAVDVTSFDLDDWADVQRQSPKVREQVQQLSQKVDYAPDLMADLHAGLFKVDNRRVPVDEMAPTHRANHAVMDEILDTTEVKILRQHTVGDKFGSAIGMQAMQEAVVESLRQVREAQQQQQDDLQKQIDDLNGMMPGLGGALAAAQDPNLSPLDQQAAAQNLQAALDQFNNQKVEVENAQQAADAAAQAAANAVKDAARSAAKQATADLDEQEALMQGFGVDPGEVQKMSVKERLDLARKLKDNRLSKFIKLLGQFKQVQQAESRKRVVNASNEIHGVTHSNNLERMTVGEYLNFADPALEFEMWARWAEHQLITHDVRGKENLGQGPIICVVDESGSMDTDDVAGGTREAWSKALSLAMLEQARHRKRDFVYIGFSSVGQQHMVEFLGGQSDLTKVIKMTEHFFDGGTHYEKPLMMALDYIEKRYDERQLERPDIVFITDDDYCKLSEPFLETYRRIKDKTSIKTYGIALGCTVSGALAQLSDNVREITELASDPRMVGDLFRTI